MPKLCIFRWSLRSFFLSWFFVKSHMNRWSIRDFLQLVQLRLSWRALLLRYVNSLVEHYIFLDATSIACQIKPRVAICNFTVLLLINVVIHLAHLSGSLALTYDDFLIIIDSAAQYLWCALHHGGLAWVLGRGADDFLGLTLCCHLISLIPCATLIWVTDQFLKSLLVVIYARTSHFLAIELSQHSWWYSDFVWGWLSLYRWMRCIMFRWASIFSVIFRL